MPRSSEDAHREGEAKSSPPDRLPAPPLLGEVISGRYRVTDLIATGGMSSVYLGQHVHMMKRVAIKVLDSKAEQLPELVARFQREAIAGAHVQHPNIASATDFGQLKDGSYFLVLEYVPGTTLNQLIARGPLGVQRSVGIARQLASGLGAAHDVGIVHRDVKPTNVILVEGSNDVVKLIDFGFAQVKLSKVPSLAPPPDEPPAPEKMLTQAGVVLGTVAYMAPEAALGMGAVDHRSDLYALGLILYELLAGKHPFEATEPVKLFLQQRTMAPPPIATRAPGVKVPAALESVVRKLLEKDPKDRYQSAAEMISALDTAMMSLAFEMVPELGSLPDTGLFGTGLASSESGEPVTVVREPVAAPVAQDRAAAVARDSTAPAAREPVAAPAVRDSVVAAAFPTSPPGDIVGALIPPEKASDAKEPGAAAGAVDLFVKLRERVVRSPGVAALVRALPKDGRFPPWAYVAMPVLAVLFIALMILLARRAPRVAHEAARTDEVLTAPDKGGAPSGNDVERGPFVVSRPEASRDVGSEGGLDAAGWRMNLRNAARQKDWAKGSEAVLTLLRIQPAAFRDHDVQNGTRNVAVALEDNGGEPPDKFFGALTNDTGPDGLDLLYDIARYRAWTKAGKRAIETLRRPEVMMRASAPLKALFEFREASCVAKRDTFAKMAAEGDERALSELTSLQGADCGRRDPCCYKESRALATAIRDLKTRLRSPSSPPL